MRKVAADNNDISSILRLYFFVLRVNRDRLCDQNRIFNIELMVFSYLTAPYVLSKLSK